MPQQNVTEPDPTNVPPYEGRTTGRRDDDISEALTGTVERQLDETKTGRPGATASPADESPVRPDEVASPGAAGGGTSTATDPNATTARGVGTNMTRRGEDVVEEDGEDGRYRTGTQGESQRPVGESTARDSTGIDPQEPSGPTMPASGSSAGS
ncbi:MAG TPA: hypothetical protein VL337_05485 [Acidimicrobiales bacterium]|jgi:hypothetical protein|nr:hypothetical protein [Acidimicrobiales bacterium]